MINCPVTFGLGADCEESIVCEELEQRPDSVRVSSQEDFSVGRVQQDESKDTVQQRSHLLDAEAVVQVEQNLTVHFGLVVKVKLFPQLEDNRRNTTEEVSLCSLVSFFLFVSN